MKNFFRFSIVLLLGGLLLPNAIDAKEHPVWHGIRTPVPLSTQGEGYTNWQWLNPLPHGNPTTGIWIFDANTFLIAGEVGSVVKTTNAGATWNVQFHAGGQYYLGATAFTDGLTGFILGEELIKSSDGGSTWIEKTTIHNGSLSGISFGSHDTGYIVSKGGTILRTVDGGESWRDTAISDNLELNSVSAPDPLHAFAAGVDLSTGKSICVGTTDGGEHWINTVVNDTTDFIATGISFPDSMKGWIAGWINNGIKLAGYIFHTTDGGLTWAQQKYPMVDPWYMLFDVSFADSTNGVVVGDNGHRLITTDGGVTWSQPAPDGIDLYLRGVRMLNDTVCITTGDFGTIGLTTDGGHSWRDLHTRGPDWASLAFPDSAHGYAMFWQGVVWRTTDGGNTWADSKWWGEGDVCASFAFSDFNHGIMVGINNPRTNGVIRVTSDGALSWHKTYSAGPSLNSVAVRGSLAWAVGDAGTILFSSDGGETWSSQASGTTKSLGSVSFLDDTIGSAAGESGTILHTTDGGATWTAQNSGTDCGVSVLLTDANTGFALGNYDWSRHVFLKTTDGGATWIDKSANVPGYILFNVSFVDRNNGAVVREGGSVLRTTDGGDTWIPWETPCSVNLYNIKFVRSGPGYVSYILGRWGTILVAAMSPQNTRTWTWTGLADSSWNNPGNWSPAAVPQPGDSVLIPPAEHNPVMDSSRTQIAIGALNIQPGGKLTITDSLGRLIVLGEVIIDGTLEISSTANPNIIVGGSWIIGSGGGGAASRAVPSMQKLISSGGQGFIPSHSRVEFSGHGTISGTFYNVTIDSLSDIHSNGNIFLMDQATLLSDLTMGTNDTIYVRTGFEQPFVGPGNVVGGTLGHFTIYAITATAGAHGRTSPTGSTSVISGRDIRVLFLPDTGYHVDSVFVDGSKVDSTAGYTFTNVSEPHAIRVVFAINRYTIDASAGLHGGITPSGSVLLTYGGSQRFVFNPENGYYVDSVIVDGFVVDSTVGYTFTAISSDHAIRVAFIHDVLFITATSGPGGAIAPSGTITIGYERSRRFTFTPNTGYHVDSVLADGFKVDSVYGYTFANVIANHTLRVVFALNRYTITATAGRGGTVAPSGDVAVTYGGIQRFVFTPLGNYRVDSVIIDGFAVDSLNGYTFSNIGGPHTVRVVFLPIFHAAQGWNMVSVPAQLGLMDKSSVFPTAIGSIYDYEEGYTGKSILENGTGYWAKFPSAQVVGKTGALVLDLSIPLVQGWNMIGAPGAPMLARDITSDPPAMVTSKFYGYDRRYVTVDTLMPWRGYWVKVNRAGTLILSPAPSAARAGLVRITDVGEQPPPPPDEIQNVSNRIPDDFTLRQNYPNPFNPATMLRYDLPANAHVRLTIYNVLGQTIATLVDGVQTAGYKSITWNAANVPSGLYFYRLEARSNDDPAKSFIQMKKMMLVR